MKKLLKHKKALSPVVAAIILIAVTVAVSIAVAAWMGALTIGFMGTEELKVTGVEFTDTDTIITVKNIGTAKVVIEEVRAGGVSLTDVAVLSPSGSGNELPAGETGTITWSRTLFAWTEGTAYDFEIVTGKGNIFVGRAYAPQ